jgi:band 4.1-like protein 4A
VRSVSYRNINSTTGTRQRSSSVESQSSNDSRYERKHRSRSRRISDNESEMSRGSSRSGRSHRKNRRRRSQNRESGSERETKRIFYNKEPTLIDSEKQWLEVQQKQAEISNMRAVPRDSSVNSRKSSKTNPSQDTYHRRKKNRYAMKALFYIQLHQILVQPLF